MIGRFLIFSIACVALLSCTTTGKKKVGLKPYDHFNQALVDTVSLAIKKEYGFDVIILPSSKMPQEAFVNIKTPRYRADKLIKLQRETKPDTLDFIIGLTDNDISCTSTDAFGFTKKPESKYSDWGIFGYGYEPGSSCIVSTFRLKSPIRSVFVERLKKIAIHELGHNLGLDHCTSEFCVMRDAVETIKTIDHVKPSLCDRCQRQIGIPETQQH